ncbi:LOW QUALITY PROTEIN: hypothetical protein CVT26_010758 [Gymnopilus dilepis]|uniref:Uncharacterized protein n=1 Tax=Gymnopilus dilepis TaxID=231916 RepID=A0A409W587_9AGAR|nr:LOW QUALITY PROTEIN: hypothetical protein CVT26_010758 [Gymnopilus dilepis]
MAPRQKALYTLVTITSQHPQRHPQFQVFSQLVERFEKPVDDPRVQGMRLEPINKSIPQYRRTLSIPRLCTDQENEVQIWNTSPGICETNFKVDDMTYTIIHMGLQRMSERNGVTALREYMPLCTSSIFPICSVFISPIRGVVLTSKSRSSQTILLINPHRFTAKFTDSRLERCFPDQTEGSNDDAACDCNRERFLESAPEEEKNIRIAPASVIGSSSDVNIIFALPIAYISPISTHPVHDAECFTAKLPTFKTRSSYYYRFLMAVAVRCFNHIRLRRGWNCLCIEN